jgi:putative photosynthetic complex assembly protein 2
MSLDSHWYPILFTLVLWWFSTGAILYLDGLPRRTFRWSLAGATVLLAGALLALAATAEQDSVWASYVAFSGAIIVWGWVEMSFLMGLITGPRVTACPHTSNRLRRAWFAFQAIAYHELALLAGAVLIAVVTWDGPNQLGLLTYLVLWVARLSTKLNLFLGVRNLSEEFLPDHLKYMQSYFTRRPMNMLFPFSLIASTLLAVTLWRATLLTGAEPTEAVALSFLAMLATLAVLEHLFLVVPINFGALWDWAMASRRVAATPAAPRT